MTTIQTYVPSPPTSGLTTIYITRVTETADSILLYYDIALGPSAGYAYSLYQVTGFGRCVGGSRKNPQVNLSGVVPWNPFKETAEM